MTERLRFTNGRLRTMDAGRPVATDLLVEDGCIVEALDGGAGVPAESDWRVVDLEGATVLPAFTDGHAHLTRTGLRLLDLDLDGVGGVEEGLDLLASAARAADRPVIRGWGYDETRSERPLTARDLDRVTDRPVFLGRVGDLAALVNSAAMELLGVPEGMAGVLRADGGELSGWLTGQAYHYALRQLHRLLGEEERREALDAAVAQALAAGVTCVHAIEGSRFGQLMGGRMEPNHDLERLLAADLPLDLVPFDTQIHGLGDLGRIARAGLRHAGGDLQVDGVLGPGAVEGVARAALSLPYADGVGGRGRLLITCERLRELMVVAVDQGLQLAVHAIGDRAIALVLDAVEDVRRERSDVADMRLRLEHGLLPAESDLERAARLGIVFSVQPATELLFGGRRGCYADLLGELRVRQTNPLRELAAAGVRLAGGTASPLAPLNPLLGIAGAALHPFEGHRLDREAAFALYTTGAAWAAFEEDRRGRLRPGFLADLIALDPDPFQLPAERLSEVRVIRTWRRGREVFRLRERRPGDLVPTG